MEQNKCNKCGRPMQYATEPKCNYCDSYTSEYCGCKIGRIKEIEPTCDSTAVIPSITVDSVEGITNLANCLVHVTDTNTTYYVDDKHRIMITWAGPVDIPGYDMKNNPNGYRDQIVTDIEKGIAVIYDKHGKGFTFGIEQSYDITKIINDKLDELVESGELQRILNSPATTESLGGVIVGDGLQVDENGKVDVKAGDGITVDENGVSETPYNDYIEDIEVYRIKYEYASNNTTSYIDYAIIPATYKPSIIMSDPTNPNTRKVASEFDYEHKPTLMANFGPWNVSNDVTYGPLIIDGVTKVENNLITGSTDWEQTIMGINDDGTLVSYNGTTPANQITSSNAVRCWRTLYKEGTVSPELDLTTHNPHTWIAQDYDGNYLIAVCGGRNKQDTGMTADDQIRFVTTTVSFNARIIFNADGGGSSNLLYHGIRQNDLVNGEDRACPNWLVWSSPTAKHEAVFKNQSVNNSHNVYDFKRQRRLGEGYQYDADYIGTNFITAPAEVRSQSRITFPTPFSVIYNLEFYVNGEVGATVPANTILLNNLPWTSGNYYVMGLNRSDDTPVQFVLRQETAEDGHRYSTLRNVSAIPVRKNYTFNQAFWTVYRQFDE